MKQDDKSAKQVRKAKAPARKTKRKDDGELEAVAAALGDAAAAVENGEMHVGEDVETERSPLIRALYGASYGMSFGVVFPAMLFASVLPMDNPFGHGLIDGAHAARDKVDHLKADRARPHTTPTTA